VTVSEKVGVIYFACQLRVLWMP